MAHLAVLAFDEGEAHPTRWDVGAIADRRDALPKVFGRGNDFRLAGFGAIALDGHAFFQLIYSFLCDLSVNLGEIGARMLEFRVQKFLDEFAVVGEEQGTFAVVVKAACCIHIRWEPEFIQSPMSGFGSELAKHAKRLVEQNHHNNYALKQFEGKTRFL